MFWTVVVSHQLSNAKSVYHRLRGSVSTVVTMTSKVNGKTEISTPCKSETPENIEAKFGKNDYVMDPYNLANFRGNLSSGVCYRYCDFVYPFPSFPFLSFFSCRRLQQQESWAIAKMTAHRAMRPMYGRPENFQESLTTPTATFPEFLMGFCSDGRSECTGQIWNP